MGRINGRLLGSYRPANRQRIDVQPRWRSPVHEKNMTPGLQKYDSITLKRGVFTGDNENLRWLTTDSFDRIGRQDITITLLNEKHEPVLKWRARNAFPTKISAPGLKADGKEVAVESIEIHHEGLVIE